MKQRKSDNDLKSPLDYGTQSLWSKSEDSEHLSQLCLAPVLPAELLGAASKFTVEAALPGMTA